MSEPLGSSPDSRPKSATFRLVWGIIGTIAGLATMGSALAWMIVNQRPVTKLPTGTDLTQDQIAAIRNLADTEQAVLARPRGKDDRTGATHIPIDEAIRRYAADPKQPTTAKGP